MRARVSWILARRIACRIASQRERRACGVTERYGGVTERDFHCSQDYPHGAERGQGP